MFKEKAQAITELAILGVLVIVAFSFLISYSEKLNRQQANMQQTFRAALDEAKKINNSINYTKKVFSRMPSIENPKELGQLETFNDNATLLWSDGMDTENVYYFDPVSKEWVLSGRYVLPGTSKYQFNDAVKTIPSTPNEYDEYGNLIPPSMDNKGVISTTDSSVHDTKATTILSQKSVLGDANMTTEKKFEATDTVTTTVNIDGQTYTFSHSLGEHGKYSSVGAGVKR
ncbi:MAG: hypothetical protein WC543_00950 [Candidatus Omnitrophota bacterium]